MTTEIDAIRHRVIQLEASIGPTTPLAERYVDDVRRLLVVVDAAQAFVADWEGMMDEGDDVYIDRLRASLAPQTTADAVGVLDEAVK